MNLIRRALQQMPIVAILRGIKPEEVGWAFDVLSAAGIRLIEVPLNSPAPYDSIRRLQQLAGNDLLVGAGTVLSVAQVEDLHAIGAKLVVAPNCDTAVIRAAKAYGMAVLPGAFTPSEAFAALHAGADGLKMFPGELLPPAAVKAWRTVMPPETLLLPVGGVTADNMAAYIAASADGFGIGSSLYKPGVDAAELKRRVDTFVSRLAEIRAGK
ncbi:MAG TPA: 2-dehydro-3-deoxy-6-phosphogalactonate aldolase [Dongiaceae bacterium]|nr:2-dehydro-3-deoxy-6-phosphogalactonate aldolase [Dongiaceae bacterium]